MKKRDDKLRSIPALVWGEKEPCQSMRGTHRHTAHFAQIAMEHPQAKLCLWEVMSLPPRNSCWTGKYEQKLLAGQGSCSIKNTRLFPRISPKLCLSYAPQEGQ